VLGPAARTDPAISPVTPGARRPARRPPHHSHLSSQGATGPAWDYAVRVRDEASIRDLARPDFLAMLSDLTAIYAAAMGAGPAELPARRAIMERHTGNPRFQAVVATSQDHDRAVGFAYGFLGAPGQWCHDVVNAVICGNAG
jgi:hypothetical protein